MTPDIPGIGSLEPQPALEHLDWVAQPVRQALEQLAAANPDLAAQAQVVQIDPAFADTETMTKQFNMDLALSSNCILVSGKRAGVETIVACVIRANTNVDVNHTVRKLIGARKASFWSQDAAVEASGMEYGGITPVGIPADWRLMIDSRCADGWSCIGSGLRSSKLFVPGALLVALPGAEIIDGLAH